MLIYYLVQYKTMKRGPRILDLRGFLSFHILSELKKGKKCGDELAAIIGKKKGTKLTPGTIYPALKKLKRTRLISACRKEGRKKRYEITKSGKKEYNLTKKIVKKMFRGI